MTEIICHLRDVEREVNLPRIRRVLAEQNPFLVGEVTDVWVFFQPPPESASSHARPSLRLRCLLLESRHFAS